MAWGRLHFLPSQALPYHTQASLLHGAQRLTERFLVRVTLQGHVRSQPRRGQRCLALSQAILDAARGRAVTPQIAAQEEHEQGGKEQ